MRFSIYVLRFLHTMPFYIFMILDLDFSKCQSETRLEQKEKFMCWFLFMVALLYSNGNPGWCFWIITISISVPYHIVNYTRAIYLVKLYGGKVGEIQERLDHWFFEPITGEVSRSEYPRILTP